MQFTWIFAVPYRKIKWVKSLVEKLLSFGRIVSVSCGISFSSVSMLFCTCFWRSMLATLYFALWPGRLTFMDHVHEHSFPLAGVWLRSASGSTDRSEAGERVRLYYLFPQLPSVQLILCPSTKGHVSDGPLHALTVFRFQHCSFALPSPPKGSNGSSS